MNATWDFNWAGSISTTLDCNIFPFPFLYLLHRKVVKIALDYAWKTNTKDKQFFDTNLLVYIYIYTHFLILWNEIFVIVKKLEVILWERRFPKFIENLYIYKKRMDLVFQVHTKWLVNVLDIDYDGILLLICLGTEKLWTCDPCCCGATWSDGNRHLAGASYKHQPLCTRVMLPALYAFLLIAKTCFESPTYREILPHQHLTHKLKVFNGSVWIDMLHVGN